MIVVQADAFDDGEALGVVGPHGEGEGERKARAVLDLDDDELVRALHRVGALDRVATGHGHCRLHHR